MSVRLIAGRAGSGKSHHARSQICRELARSLVDGPRLVMLVPEQAALQMERGLLAMLDSHNIKTLGRCEVLSFRRLAHRIFVEAAGPTPTPLTPLGRQMALRLLISRHRRSLREFARVADRGSFISEIARGIAELLQEAVSVDQLESAARAADEAGDPAAARLHDTALLYRAYLDYLGDARVDPEGVLDLARTRLSHAPWLQGASIFIDGFAGLTRQQVRMLTSLATIASHMDIALILDSAPPDTIPARTFSHPITETSLFARTEQTWSALVHAFREQGVAIETPLCLDATPLPRFQNTPTLAQIERDVFVRPPIAHAADRIRPPAEPLHSSSGEPRELRILRTPNRRDEVDFVAGEILNLVRRREQPARFRDIAIIVRDLSPYHDILAAALTAHGIPYFIDHRRPTHHHALIHLVRGLATMASASRFDEAVIRILKSGLSGMSDDETDAVENYSLAFNLARPETWNHPWTRPLPGSPSAHRSHSRNAQDEEVRRVESVRSRIRAALADLWPAERNAAASELPCSTWVRRLYAALDQLGTAHILDSWQRDAQARGDMDEAAEHEHVWADLMALFDELDTGLGDQPMTGRQFLEVLESGLADFTLGLVPPTLDQVLVGSIERSRNPPLKAAFVLGFCDGGFPSRVTEDALLGEAERSFLAACKSPIGRSRDEMQADERALAYIALTRASERLFVTYPATDAAGRALEPSPYLNSLLAAVPEAVIEHLPLASAQTIRTAGALALSMSAALGEWARGCLADVDAVSWRALHDWTRTRAAPDIRAKVASALRSVAPIEDTAMTDAARRLLWPPPHTTSVTRLEEFARCPFRHFARYGLGLTERPVHDVSPVHLGNLYHQLVEQFINQLLEAGETLAELTDEQINRRITELCDQILPAYADEVGLSDAERRTVRWRARWELPYALRGQRATVARTLLTPALLEKSFGNDKDSRLPAIALTTADGETVLVQGKIDRVDFMNHGAARLAVVFDYKRAVGRRLALQEVFHGLALQLTAYLLVLQSTDRSASGVSVIPGGAFYLPLLGRHTRIAHPADADAPDFDPYAAFRPRGVVDFDWIDQFDPTLQLRNRTGTNARPAAAASAAFAVKRTKDGAVSDLNRSDALPDGSMKRLLEHVRSQMTTLAGAWLGGDIRVLPYRLGKQIACDNCPHQAVCRFDFTTHQVRMLNPISRSEVIDAIAGSASHPHDDAEPASGGDHD